MDRVLLAVQVVMLTLVALIACGWILLIILGNFVWDTDDSKNAADNKPSPTPTETGTPITWPTITQQCRDGWGSPSIGRPGACSWHGGVITIYHSSLGNLATLCPPSYQAKTLERANALLAADGTVDCDYGQSPNPQGL
jgi:hypothetical protein